MRRGTICRLRSRHFSVLSFLEKCNCSRPHFYRQLELIPSVIDILANSKMRLDSVKRMTQIQNTS